jgi:hypothetical protein
MTGRERIVEIVRRGFEAEAAAPDRNPALELVHVQVDPGVEQRAQRLLDTAVGDQFGHVAELDPRVPQEPPIGTLRPLEDALLEDSEKIVRAGRQIGAEPRPVGLG